VDHSELICLNSSQLSKNCDIRRPIFLCSENQGVSGGTPWHAFAFLPFYFQQSGYSDVEAGQILFYGGQTVGGLKCEGVAGR